MSKCYACGMEDIKDGVARCPLCGFSIPRQLVSAGENSEFAKIMSDTGKQYRENKIGGMKVGIYTYSYDEKLQMTGEHELVVLDSLEKMDIGEIIWSENKFARMDAGQEIILTAFVMDKDGKTKKKELSLVTPELLQLWKVGAMLEKGLQVRLLVGDSNVYAKSKETLALLE